jgi:tripartite-type tricarboxylate transporter receptor subunit TctC
MRILKLSLCAAALFGLSGALAEAQAQNFPNRTITLVFRSRPAAATRSSVA